MELSEIYRKGEAALKSREIGWSLGGVETGFIFDHDRRILDRYTFLQQCIDAPVTTTRCKVLGVDLDTPVIMSAITMPIPAIVEDGLMEVALGLKDAGSLMWTGTPLPKELRQLVDTGVPIAANVKPFADRNRLFQALEEILAAGVQWVGIEIDAGHGTKIGDRQVASDCAPLSLSELKEIRRIVKRPLIFKGVLSGADAAKSMEAGADGIMVSNHGAHTIDYLPHPLQVMDEIMRLAHGNIVVMVECGFRRGSDVLKGLAFGAALVGLGRPILYGLAADGRDGVRQVVAQITQELVRIMSLLGEKDAAHVSREILLQDP
jgi:isopentenyl diphosphate isomerase/L-lactate dehydrogenase-like FMN-dependent dehydrogenase